MNRRDNGLVATEWAPLADVESALTDHVLTALAAADIAAYAETASSGEAVYLGSGRSTGPSDRITVNREQRREARSVIDALLPELRAELAEHRRTHDDQAWTQIVADLENAPASESSSSSDEPSPSTAGSPSDDEWADVRPARPEVPAELINPDDDEHFVPPPAPPVPSADPITRAAWTGLIGGPLFVIVSSMLGRGNEGFAMLLAVGAFVGGFVTLVTRMKDRPTLDESDDDGAVV